MAFGIGKAIVTSNLLVYLDALNPRSYPGTGNTWADLSGNALDFTRFNNVPYNTTYFDFDGSLFHKFERTNASQTYVFDEMTLEVWIRNLSAGYVVSSLNTNGLDGWFIKSTSGGAIGGAYHTTDGNQELTQLFDTSQWTRLVLVHRQDGLDFWVNQNKNSYYTTGTWSFDNYATDMHIGNDNHLDDYYGTFQLALLRLYNRALTDMELDQNFNAQRSRFGL